MDSGGPVAPSRESRPFKLPCSSELKTFRTGRGLPRPLEFIPESTMTKSTYSEPDYADAEFAERLRVVDETTLPHVCTHDESLELYRRASGARGAAPRARYPPHCRQCGHALPNNGPLRARDVPGLTHAL